MFTGYLMTHSKDVRAVCIASGPPLNYKGIWYEKLAPSHEMLVKYANGMSWDNYVIAYQKILKQLDAAEVVSEICNLTGLEVEGEMSPILLDWGNSNQVECLRHIAANWLKAELGYKVVELHKNAEVIFDYKRYPKKILQGML